MPKRKNSLLLFSKLPEAGLVKTRLTTLKDGMFDPEVASVLYHCMLFDVVEICMAALAKLEAKSDEDTYELVISVAPKSNLEKMERLFSDAGTWPRDIAFIADEGASFDEHYNDAFAQTWRSGADCILSMGCDMPALTEDDVIRGFDALHELCEIDGGGIVLAPDQEMGVSIIGWTKVTVFDHTGVFYNQDGLTVLPAYIQKARALSLPAIWLPPVADVDTMADLMHNVTLVEALNYCEPLRARTAPYRTQRALEQMGITDIRVAPNNLMDPRENIDK